MDSVYPFTEDPEVPHAETSEKHLMRKASNYLGQVVEDRQEAVKNGQYEWWIGGEKKGFGLNIQESHERIRGCRTKGGRRTGC